MIVFDKRLFQNLREIREIYGEISFKFTENTEELLVVISELYTSDNIHSCMHIVEQQCL